MKVLLVLLAVYALWWLLRRSLAEARRASPPPAASALPPRPVLACAYCGLHLPREEALVGQGGAVFCGEAHRAAYEKAPVG